MVDNTNPVEPAVVNLNRLLKQQSALREVAEKRVRKAHGALLRVAGALCGRALDQIRLADPGGLSGWEADEIASLVIDEVQQQLDQVDLSGVAGDDAMMLYQQANAAIEELRAELDQARRQVEEAVAAREQAEEQTRVAQAQARVLEQMVINLQQQAPLTPTDRDQVSAPPVRLRPGPEPEWMEKWRDERGFERTAALVTVMGETGECRRSRLARLVGERLGLDARHGGVKRTFGRLAKQGLVQVTQFQQVITGRSTHLLRLSPRGQQAYLFLTHAEAVPSLLDEMLARHKSPEHAFLNMEAADLLEEAGYTVDRFPAEMQLPEGGKFLPDLGAVSPDGEVLWVEVERDTGKSLRDRNRKWANYYEASGGHFVVVTADRRAMQKVRSEIAYWAGTRPLRLWMTNVTETRAGKRGRDGSIWLYQRE